MSAEVVIRAFEPADWPGVEAVWAACGLGGRVRGDDAEVIERTLRADGAFLVLCARAGGEVIGTSWLTCDARRMYLHHFGVLPAQQGRGLGRLLLDATLAVVVRRGLQVKLEVARDNVRAIALYEKAGFAPLGDYASFIVRDVSALAR